MQKKNKKQQHKGNITNGQKSTNVLAVQQQQTQSGCVCVPLSWVCL